MNCLPSPPSSPRFSFNTISVAVCGDCNKGLGSDWFCSDCHQKCLSCNRFLGQDDYCSRCWSFDPIQHKYKRKSVFIQSLPQTSFQYHSPSSLNITPSSSTGSNL